MSASYALQVAIVSLLENDASVGAIIGKRIYDGMPRNGSYPCVTIGSSDINPVGDLENCVSGNDVALQLDCWSRDNGKLHPTRTLTDLVSKVINRADLTLADPYTLLTISARNRVDLDRDQKTGHGVVVIEAEIDGA